MFKKIAIYFVSAVLLFTTGVGVGSFVGKTTIINESPRPAYTEVPMPDGRTAKVLAEHEMDVMVTNTPGTTYSSKSNDQSASGPGLNSGNSDALPKVDVGTSPSITNAGIFSGKGFAFSVTQVVKNGINVLYIIGGICIVLGGIVSWVSKDWTGLLYIGGAGVLIIAAAVFMNEYPWVILIAGVAGLALIGWWIYRTIVNAQTKTAVVQQSSAETEFTKLVNASDKFTSDLKLVIADLWTKAKAMSIDTNVQKTIDKIV